MLLGCENAPRSATDLEPTTRVQITAVCVAFCRICIGRQCAYTLVRCADVLHRPKNQPRRQLAPLARRCAAEATQRSPVPTMQTPIPPPPPSSRHHSPGGRSGPGTADAIAPRSIGSRTSDLNGSRMSARASHAAHHGPPPTSSAAVVLRASTSGDALRRPAPSMLHTRRRHAPKNVSRQCGARPLAAVGALLLSERVCGCAWMGCFLVVVVQAFW